MKLDELIPLIEDEYTCITVPLESGSSQTFDVNIVKGARLRDCSPEYVEWLKTLNLDVRSISYGEVEICLCCASMKLSVDSAQKDNTDKMYETILSNVLTKIEDDLDHDVGSEDYIDGLSKVKEWISDEIVEYINDLTTTQRQIQSEDNK